jgi:hypothetical protein
MNLDSDKARSAAGRTLAALEEDCSQTWPHCPRSSLLCDCRLRAVRVLNALRLTGPALPRRCRVHVCGWGFCYTCSLISPFQNPHVYATRAREQ